MMTTTDCGGQPNPCTNGMVASGLALALYYAAQDGATLLQTTKGADAKALLEALHMSPASVAATTQVMTKFVDTYGVLATANTLHQGVPCGSGISNTSHFDEYASNMLGFGPKDTAVCATRQAGVTEAACMDFWAAPNWPHCPETIVQETGDWGTCASHLMNCPVTKAYFDDTNPMFMDWWTIFYWAWWITWAPFVGFFVAIISRGRTVREVIVGGFFCPTLFAIIWFSVFGGLAIKMERMAEIALKVRPEVHYATVTCAEHYTTVSGGGIPISPESKKLAAAGYYMLSCMPKDDQIYRLMEPYKNLTGFLHVFLWFGLVVYFLTSSDSGSMTDDIISASGLQTHKIPIWQKVFWCFTEGIVAISLVAASNGNTLKTLQHVSIIIGLPYTFLLCFMVPSLYRALKREMGDTDIIKSMRFNTQIFDIAEFFKPHGGSPCLPGTHIKSILLGLLVPGFGVHAALAKCYPESKTSAVMFGTVTQLLQACWVVLQIVETGREGAHTISWLCATGMLLSIAYSRGELRRKYNVWGSPLDDLFTTMCAYPFVLGQMLMQADTDGEGAPTYFACVDQMQAEMAALMDDGPALPTVTGKDIQMADAPSAKGHA